MSRSPLRAPRTALAVTAGKLAGRASLLAGRGGATSLPGLVAQRIDPDVTGTLAAELPHGALVVSGTNGKTTTAALLAAALRAGGLRPIHNRAGANLARGIASALLEQAGPRGRLRVGSDAIGLFEVDEAALPSIMQTVQPSLLVVTNLFRDQLDRYGELDVVAARWRAALDALPPQAALVLNADDPLVAALGDDAGRRVIYYGLDLPAGRFERPPESADSIACRRCGALLDYKHVYYGHLGQYRCPRCGWARPHLDVRGVAVAARGLEGSTLRAEADGVTVDLELRVPGLYNAYNALAALAAAACARGIDAGSAARAMVNVKAAFGRAERIHLAGRDVWLLLVKNPTGCDEVLRLLAEQPAPLDLLAVLNDNAADGRDVSWIWDTALEDVVAALGRVTFAGTRAEEMALRFKYAGYAAAAESAIVGDPLAALDAAMAALPAAAPLYVLATYTAMLELRRGLVARGVLRHYLGE